MPACRLRRTPLDFVIFAQIMVDCQNEGCVRPSQRRYGLRATRFWMNLLREHPAGQGPFGHPLHDFLGRREIFDAFGACDVPLGEP